MYLVSGVSSWACAPSYRVFQLGTCTQSKRLPLKHVHPAITLSSQARVSSQWVFQYGMYTQSSHFPVRYVHSASAFSSHARAPRRRVFQLCTCIKSTCFPVMHVYPVQGTCTQSAPFSSHARVPIKAFQSGTCSQSAGLPVRIVHPTSTLHIPSSRSAGLCCSFTGKTISESKEIQNYFKH